MLIREALKKKIYLPLLSAIGEKKSALQNASEYEALWLALNKGTLTYNRGKFSGKFDSAITKKLKSLGAEWDRRSGTFNLPLAQIPTELEMVIRATEHRFSEKISGLDIQLRKILPEQLVEGINLAPMLDTTIFKVESRFRENVKHIALSPELTDEQRRKIADEWQGNLRLYIKKFADEEILSLREKIRATTFAGDRYGSFIKVIERSYGVTENKAKFLARQETKLLTTKYQESRYLGAGIPEYRWKCVTGTKDHPTRPRHKELDGTIQRWDKPPISTGPGEPVIRNNPGQDYGCRCSAIPIVRFAA